MARIRFFHHCKIVLLTVVIFAAASGVCGLFWLNQQGFGGEWGDRIARELSDRGVYADFEEARYSPLRGIMVREAVFYTDEAKTDIFARIPGLRIEIDRSKALRGELVLRELVLRHANIDVPLVSTPGHPTVARIRSLSGSVTVDRQGRFILRNGTGQIGGMDFDLDAELDDFDLRFLAGRTRTDDTGGVRARFFRALFDELSDWSITGNTPPRLEIKLSGNFSRLPTIRTSFSLDAPGLRRNGYSMENVYLAGEFRGRHLTFDTLRFSHGTGGFKGRAGYDLKSREGRYEVQSDIDLQRMLSSCFHYDELEGVVPPQAPTVDAEGSFSIAPDSTWNLHASGKLTMPAFLWRGTSYEKLETDFSWHDGDIFLRNLHVIHKKGALQGRVLIQGDTIRYSAESTLPVPALNVFILPESGLSKIIGRASFNEASTVRLVADGTIRRKNFNEWTFRDWSSHGNAELTNFTYNGVPLESLTANYSMTPAEHVYTDVTGRFDYRNYPLHRRHGGPASAPVRAERIVYDRVSNFTRISKLEGTAWPGPVLRLFTPKAAKHVEDNYRFRSPPYFLTSGRVGHRIPPRRPDATDTTRFTDVLTTLRATSTTEYTFLDRDVDLDKLGADVRYRHQQVDVTNLKCRSFGGPVGGAVHINLPSGKPASFEGGIHWTRLRFAEIGNTYNFGKTGPGFVTGRFDFRGVRHDIRSLNGTGAIGLEHGHLFYVPILGPLSPILGEILGNKRTSHEEARDASCTFAIKDGVFLTRDFLTSTPSIVFTGDGAIDLHAKTIDMTIRMNARGLFGIITLPLRPFNGLFQFRGQGTLKNPVWKNAPFVSPPDGKNDPLFRKPGKAQIIRNAAEIVPER